VQPFEYLSVMISIVLGLGVTQLLTGLGQLVRARHEVRLYLPTLLWMLSLLAVHVQSWWSSFGLRNQAEWSFGTFALVLLQPMLLFLLAALLTPELDGQASSETGRKDLRASYFRHRRPFFVLFIGVLAVSVAKEIALQAALPEPLNLAAHGVFLALGLIGLSTSSARAHAVIAPTAALLMIAYIGALFVRLD
jgi:hypothetical protein